MKKFLYMLILIPGLVFASTTFVIKDNHNVIVGYKIMDGKETKFYDKHHVYVGRCKQDDTLKKTICYDKQNRKVSQIEVR